MEITEKTVFHLSLDEPLEDDFYDYLIRWMEAPHVKFDNVNLSNLFTKEYLFHSSYYGNLGNNGEYFACDAKHYKQYKDLISDGTYNFPSMYCPWTMFNDKQTLLFKADAFSALSPLEANMWLQYIIDNFFEPNGYLLNGNLVYNATDEYIVKNNKIMNY